MVNFDFGFIGWNQGGTSDKVWGYFWLGDGAFDGVKHNDRICIFWGRRGKAMQFKEDRYYASGFFNLVNSKLKKGYQQISKDKLYNIWPNFEEEAAMKLSFEKLAGKIS